VRGPPPLPCPPGAPDLDRLSAPILAAWPALPAAMARHKPEATRRTEGSWCLLRRRALITKAASRQTPLLSIESCAALSWLHSQTCFGIPASSWRFRRILAPTLIHGRSAHHADPQCGSAAKAWLRRLARCFPFSPAQTGLRQRCRRPDLLRWLFNRGVEIGQHAKGSAPERIQLCCRWVETKPSSYHALLGADPRRANPARGPLPLLTLPTSFFQWLASPLAGWCRRKNFRRRCALERGFWPGLLCGC